MASLAYATLDQFDETDQFDEMTDPCEELKRQIRSPEIAASMKSDRLLAHAPAIGGSVLRMIHTILANADVDFALRELAILRVAKRCRARRAWIQHAAIARSLGMSNAKLTALEQGDTHADFFSDRERAVLAFTDEVLDGPCVSDRAFNEAQKELSPCELAELLLTIGYFRMIGGLLTTLDVEV